MCPYNRTRGVGVPPLSHRFATGREHRGEQPAAKRGGLGDKAPLSNAAGRDCDNDSSNDDDNEAKKRKK